MANSVLEVKNASLDIKKDRVLEDITLKMEAGRVYGLLGRNGAGKTSLLSLIASFRKPTRGVVTIDGQDPYENAELMPKVDFLYEVDYSEEYRTPEDFCRMTQRYKQDFDTDYAYALLDGFRIDRRKALNRMSKGQQAAVNAVLGLASNSPVTIFDEVTNGMDAPSREYFYQKVIEANARSPRIMILSTHIVSEMEYLFDEVIIIHQGRVMLQEPLDIFLERGFRVTGPKEKVAHFTRGMDVLATEYLGPTQSDMVLGHLEELQRQEAQSRYLNIAPLKLQELFIRMTEDREGVQ
ncbi:ATP-binding cassette domain-containing protein [Salinicoccus luteus]|uniref:ATP-binding cassette domain-containing protein n=1 Tax=Salinicoccus luteus TaxID=367840 RepID=UPI0004E20A28|nr:ABC transporter ATP-binding protein [Salinicoccus luteus]